MLELIVRLSNEVVNVRKWERLLRDGLPLSRDEVARARGPRQESSLRFAALTSLTNFP